MRWMPPTLPFFDEMVRVLTPIQAISDDSRPYSIFGQRFNHDFKAARLGKCCRFVAAHPELHPDHVRPRRQRQRVLHDASAYCEARKISTMSIGCGISASFA